MNFVTEFNTFLDQQVNLNPNRLETLHRNVREVSEFLSRKLDSFVTVEHQGSYALKTIIKPHKGNEYDADVLLYMKEDKAKKPADYLAEVHECFKKDGNFEKMAKPNNRSITLHYAGDFHLDVVPCVTRNGKFYVCNKRTKEFEQTDGSAYRDWFNAKTDITSGHLKSVTRLLKYMRDHQKNFDVPSILLTTFIGNSVHRSDKERPKFNTAPDTLLIVSSRINSFLQHTDKMPRMRNPMLKSERFTPRDWDQGKYIHFKQWFKGYYGKIDRAYHESNRELSLRLWRELFGNNFGR